MTQDHPGPAARRHHVGPIDPDATDTELHELGEQLFDKITQPRGEIMATPSATHYHVQRHSEDDDVLSTDSLAEAMDYAATELDMMADSEHTMIRASGEAGDYEAAYRAWEHVEAWYGLQANAANIAKQHTVPPAERAPLYRADDTAARDALRTAAMHVMEMINAEGPDGFAMWECSLTECAPVADDETI